MVVSLEQTLVPEQKEVREDLGREQENDECNLVTEPK